MWALTLNYSAALDASCRAIRTREAEDDLMPGLARQARGAPLHLAQHGVAVHEAQTAAQARLAVGRRQPAPAPALVLEYPPEH